MSSTQTEALVSALASGRALVIDGGLATELETRGHRLERPLWSARLLRDDPGAIAEVHAAYVAAGADVLITASYQAAATTFAAAGHTSEAAREAIVASVRLARDAAEEVDRPVFVAGSLGTIGASLEGGAEYRGRFGLTPTTYRDHHAPRVEALLTAGVDVIAAETLPDIEEAEALVDLLSSFDARSWLSFTCQDERRLRDGTDVARAFELCDAHGGVVAAGVNCTTPEYVGGLLTRAAAHTDKPLLAYPNSGEGWDAARQAWNGVPQGAQIATLAAEWIALGARAVGGCCRTSPRDIAALVAMVRSLA